MLTPLSTAPFFASLSIHGLHFTVYAPSNSTFISLSNAYDRAAESQFLSFNVSLSACQVVIVQLQEDQVRQSLEAFRNGSTELVVAEGKTSSVNFCKQIAELTNMGETQSNPLFGGPPFSIKCPQDNFSLQNAN